MTKRKKDELEQKVPNAVAQQRFTNGRIVQGSQQGFGHTSQLPVREMGPEFDAALAATAGRKTRVTSEPMQRYNLDVEDPNRSVQTKSVHRINQGTPSDLNQPTEVLRNTPAAWSEERRQAFLAREGNVANTGGLRGLSDRLNSDVVQNQVDELKDLAGNVITNRNLTSVGDFYGGLRNLKDALIKGEVTPRNNFEGPVDVEQARALRAAAEQRQVEPTQQTEAAQRGDGTFQTPYGPFTVSSPPGTDNEAARRQLFATTKPYMAGSLNTPAGSVLRQRGELERPRRPQVNVIRSQGRGLADPTRDLLGRPMDEVRAMRDMERNFRQGMRSIRGTGAAATRARNDLRNITRQALDDWRTNRADLREQDLEHMRELRDQDITLRGQNVQRDTAMRQLGSIDDFRRASIQLGYDQMLADAQAAGVTNNQEFVNDVIDTAAEAYTDPRAKDSERKTAVARNKLFVQQHGRFSNLSPDQYAREAERAVGEGNFLEVLTNHSDIEYDSFEDLMTGPDEGLSEVTIRTRDGNVQAYKLNLQDYGFWRNLFSMKTVKAGGLNIPKYVWRDITGAQEIKLPGSNKFTAVPDIKQDLEKRGIRFDRAEAQSIFTRQ